METRPINATLLVGSFNPTGNPGEYTFENATYVNQADQAGNGSWDVQVGFVLYVPATSFATGLPIPGVVHRYRLTSIGEITDPSLLSATMVWDELGQEGLEIPTPGSTCGLTQTSPNYKYGYAPSEGVYPDLPQGFAVQATQTDLWNITDQLETGGTGPGPGPAGTYKTTIGDASALSFTIHHSLGTRDVHVTVFELSTGENVYPGITRTGPNDVRIDFTYPVDADSHRVLILAF